MSVIKARKRDFAWGKIYTSYSQPLAVKGFQKSYSTWVNQSAMRLDDSGTAALA